MSYSLKILMLEDCVDDADYIQMNLRRSGMQFEATVVSTKDEYLDALEHSEFDIILSDHSLPQFNSMEALEIKNNKKLLTPFVLVTGAVSEEYAVSIIKQGAYDYILKDRLQRLPTAINQAIEKRNNQLDKLRAEQDLVKSIDRFRLAAKATSDVIYDWNIITGELFLGEGFEKSFGYKVGGIENLNVWLQHIHVDDKKRVTRSLNETLNSDDLNSWEEEYRYICLDGSTATVIDKGILLRDRDTNKPYRMVGAMQDITKLTSSNNDLKLFSFITSHNLNAPLSNLLAILKLINYETLDAFNKDMLSMMQTSTNQLKQTINHLAEILIIKNKEVEVQEVNVEEVIKSVKANLSEAINKIKPEISLQLNTIYIKTNKSYLDSIIQNLLTNSLKYRSHDRQAHIQISVEKTASGRSLITFSDNGLGIDLNRHKDKLFGMYQRFDESEDSKGLGLFLIKSQVSALGGTIDVKSEVGVGTTFYITL